jgi:hypothetical protein
MGDPIDRFERFVKFVAKHKIEISKDLVYAVRSAIEKLSNKTGVKLDIKLDEGHVNELEKAVKDFVKSPAFERFRPPRDPDHTRRILAKLITGVVIASDLRVAERNRRSTSSPETSDREAIQ